MWYVALCPAREKKGIVRDGIERCINGSRRGKKGIKSPSLAATVVV
jgi:hypothetical protein